MTAKPKKPADLTVHSYNGVFLLQGVTQIGKDWIADNVAYDGACAYINPRNTLVVVAPTNVEAVVTGAKADGLVVS